MMAKRKRTVKKFVPPFPKQVYVRVFDEFEDAEDKYDESDFDELEFSATPFPSRLANDNKIVYAGLYRLTKTVKIVNETRVEDV